MKAVDQQRIVTLVIDHHVRQGQQSTYEAWLKRAVASAEQQDGHLGVNVIFPNDGTRKYTSVVRFAEAWQLDEWVASASRRRLIDEVVPLLEDGDHSEVQAGSDFWFTPEHCEVRQPPKWKQAVLTYLVICPLALCIPLLWQPVFQAYPALGGLLASNLLINFCIVVPVVYVVMPWATARLSGWLNAR